jgi:GH15 family glucan-1,4-alpha-glucosidase
MSGRIENYALIGDRHSAALVGKDGSIDWLCLPRFDGPAVFAALLGDSANGRWKIAPADGGATVSRRYRPATLVLETTFTVAGGTVRLTDAMIAGRNRPRIVRCVDGLAGEVAMHLEYIVRFDYGAIVPWVQRRDGGLEAIAGSDGLLLATDVELRSEGFVTSADFRIVAGGREVFELTHYPSFSVTPVARPDVAAVEQTAAHWRTWSERCTYAGPYRDLVLRSLITLGALTYEPTGGIVAAPTSSLPERIGGQRNWDYRYCWLRDATFTLEALLAAGFTEVAVAWRNWLFRAIAGEPRDLQIVYDIRANRRMPEIELPWLAGYEGSKPVRLGNDAHGQFQLDVYGEVVDLLYTACHYGIAASENDWALFRAMVGEVERRWREPDRGLWEIRGAPQHFTHSKVMAWVALDRAVKSVEAFGIDGPVERWRETRAAIFADVCANGYDKERGSFVQAYGSPALDASTLLIAVCGFLPADDPRVIGTIAAIERDLLCDGLVYRYSDDGRRVPNVDGLPPGEGAFLACSFWLVDNYVLAGRRVEAERLFERLVGLCNDVGLLAEEYDPQARRFVGNFPQAFSHVGLINSAFNLWHDIAPATRRSEDPVEHAPERPARSASAL